MELTSTAHRELTDVTALVDEWQELHERSDDPLPFTGPDWAVPWLERFSRSGRREPFVVTVRAGGRLVGVAPLCLRRVLAGTARAVQPIGSGAPWIGPYELPALLSAPGLGRDVARAVVSRLGVESASWDWADLLLGTAAPWLEPEWLPDWSYTVLQRRTHAWVALELCGGVDVYAGRRNLKESLRRARNRLTRDFGADGWSVRRTTDPSDLPEAFDRLIDLHGSRAALRSGRPVHEDVTADREVRAYLRDVVGRMALRQAVSVYELQVGEEVLAAQMVLHTRSSSYSSMSGIDERAWPYSAVTHLQSVAVRDAQQAGHRQIILSTGPNQAKLRWSDDVRTSTQFAVVGPRQRSRVLHLAVQGKDAVASYLEARRAHRV